MHKIYEAYQYCQEKFSLEPVIRAEVGEHSGEELFITVLRKKGSPVKIGA